MRPLMFVFALVMLASCTKEEVLPDYDFIELNQYQDDRNDIIGVRISVDLDERQKVFVYIDGVYQQIQFAGICRQRAIASSRFQSGQWFSIKVVTSEGEWEEGIYLE